MLQSTPLKVRIVPRRQSRARTSPDDTRGQCPRLRRDFLGTAPIAGRDDQAVFFLDTNLEQKEGCAVTYRLSRHHLIPTHMRSVNKVILVGYVAELPESTEGYDGTRVSFTIATYREYSSEGRKREVTDYFRVVAWGKLGETCAKYLCRRQGVYVEGSLLQDAYEKEGRREYAIEVLADDVTLLTWKRKSALERASLDSIQAD